MSNIYQQHPTRNTLLSPPLGSDAQFDNLSHGSLSRRNSDQGDGLADQGFDVGIVRSYLGGLLPPGKPLIRYTSM